MAHRGAAGFKGFSPRNSILFWLTVLVALIGALVVFIYHLLHGGPSNQLRSFQISSAAAATRVSSTAADTPEAELRAAHLAAMRQATDSATR